MANHNRSDGANPNRPGRIKRWLEVTAAGALAAGALVTTTGCGAQEPTPVISTTASAEPSQAPASVNPSQAAPKPSATAANTAPSRTESVVQNEVDPNSTATIEIGADLYEDFFEKLSELDGLLPGATTLAGAEQAKQGEQVENGTLEISDDGQSFTLTGKSNGINYSVTSIDTHGEPDKDYQVHGPQITRFENPNTGTTATILGSTWIRDIRSTNPDARERVIDRIKDYLDAVENYVPSSTNRLGEKIEPSEPVRINHTGLNFTDQPVEWGSSERPAIVIITNSDGTTVGFTVIGTRNDELSIVNLSPDKISRLAEEYGIANVGFGKEANYPTDDVTAYRFVKRALNGLTPATTTTPAKK